MPSVASIYGSRLEASMLQAGRQYSLSIIEVNEVSFDDGSHKLQLTFAETDKEFTLNVTNARSIAEQLGDNYGDWPGRRVNLYKTTTQYQGKSCDCIRIGPPADHRPAPAPSRPPTPEEEFAAQQFEYARAATPPEGDSIPF